VTAANVEATAVVPADELGRASAEVERQVHGAFGSVPAEIARSGRSDTFGLPGAVGEEEVRDLAVLGFLDGIADRTARRRSAGRSAMS
jgi:hypothetical protein